MRRARARATIGARLARPVPLAAIALLVLNDHVLKAAFPGWLTGKLSDVAGLVFFPMVVHELADLVTPARAADRSDARRAALAAIATAIAFALVKSWEPAAEAYRFVLGALQWPLRAAWAATTGAERPAFARVAFVRDPSDLVALPFVLFSVALARGDGSANDPSADAPPPVARPRLP